MAGATPSPVTRFRDNHDVDWATFTGVNLFARYNPLTGKIEGAEATGGGGSSTWLQGTGYVTPVTGGNGIRVPGNSLFGAGVVPNRMVYPSQITPQTDTPEYQADIHGTTLIDLVRSVTSTGTASWKDYFTGFTGEVDVNITNPSDPRYGRFSGLLGISREVASPAGSNPTDYAEYYGASGYTVLGAVDSKSTAFGLRGDAVVLSGTYTKAKSIYGLMGTAKVTGVGGGQTLSLTGGNLISSALNSDITSLGGLDTTVNAFAFAYTPPRVANLLYGHWTQLNNYYKVGGLWGHRITYTHTGVDAHGGWDADQAHGVTNIKAHAGLLLEGWGQGNAIKSDAGEVDLTTGAATNRGIILRGTGIQSGDFIQLRSDISTDTLFARWAGDGKLYIPGGVYGIDLSGLVSGDAPWFGGRTITDTTAFNGGITYSASRSVMNYAPPNTNDPATGTHYGIASFYLGQLGDLLGNAKGGAFYGESRAYSRQGTNSVSGGVFQSSYLADLQTANAAINGVIATAIHNPTAYGSGGTNGGAFGGQFTSQHVTGMAGIIAGIQGTASQSNGALINTGIYGMRSQVTLFGTGAPEAVGIRSALTKIGSALAYQGLQLRGWGQLGGYSINTNGGQNYFNTGNINNYGIRVEGPNGQASNLLEGYVNGSQVWAVAPSGKINANGGAKLGTAATTGYVWTATDNTGNGAWAAPTGGGGGLSNAFVNIADNAGAGQFSASGSDNLQFASSGIVSVAFDAVNKRVTFSASPTTTDIAEGANLYWTPTRFDTRLAAKTTTDLAEGANLYYTAARFNSAFAGKTTNDLVENTNLYYTNARARAAISIVGLPLTYNNTTGVIGINQASGSQAGYLTAADFTTFNNKQAALGFIPVNKAGDSMGGQLNFATGAYASNTPTPDANDGDKWVISATGNVTISDPAHSGAGAKKLLQIRNTSGGSITVTAPASFRFNSTTITNIPNISAGKSRYIALVWDNNDSKWDVISVSEEY